MIIEKPPEQLVREDLMRQTLEAAARRIEQLDGNEIYQRAFKIAARAVRSLPISV